MIPHQKKETVQNMIDIEEKLEEVLDQELKNNMLLV